MRHRYLEVTFRKGKPLAACLYLPRQAGMKSVRTVEASAEVFIDYAANGEPIGLEMTAPAHVTVDHINQVLETLGLVAMSAEELTPLHATS